MEILEKIEEEKSIIDYKKAVEEIKNNAIITIETFGNAKQQKESLDNLKRTIDFMQNNQIKIFQNIDSVSKRDSFISFNERGNSILIYTLDDNSNSKTITVNSFIENLKEIKDDTLFCKAFLNKNLFFTKEDIAKNIETERFKSIDIKKEILSDFEREDSEIADTLVKEVINTKDLYIKIKKDLEVKYLFYKNIYEKTLNSNEKILQIHNIPLPKSKNDVILYKDREDNKYKNMLISTIHFCKIKKDWKYNDKVYDKEVKNILNIENKEKIKKKSKTKSIGR